ncbi:MAG TPA: MBL fold metallo-hydrolase [Micropepsaceae bacterium]|nr:MBL fold metallo-hydrolase [Micropepsaceae bacterium]
MRSIAFTAAAATLALFAGSFANAAQQQDFSKVEVKTTDLGHSVYMLEGAGGNVTVAVGTNGVIMVDSEFAPMHDKLKAAIAKLTKQPVQYLINTHYHGDHTGGNAAFGNEGAIIVAQRNVKNRLANPTPGANGQTPAAAPAAALPTSVYSDNMTVAVAGPSAQVIHVANAHTDGDSFVYFPEANVMAVGDTGGPNRYPNMDLRGGGTIDGMIAASQAFLDKANATTKIVPGHGPLSTKADFQAYHDMLVDIRGRVAKLKADGKTEDQAVAAKPLADIQTRIMQDDMASERVVRAVYETLK